MVSISCVKSRSSLARTEGETRTGRRGGRDWLISPAPLQDRQRARSRLGFVLDVGQGHDRLERASVGLKRQSIFRSPTLASSPEAWHGDHARASRPVLHRQFAGVRRMISAGGYVEPDSFPDLKNHSRCGLFHLTRN
ncbi:hypothetical protein AAHC03_021130 [Spirometra sp. Aus1]